MALIKYLLKAYISYSSYSSYSFKGGGAPIRDGIITTIISYIILIFIIAFIY
jgi:hypothetical protein